MRTFEEIYDSILEEDIIEEEIEDEEINKIFPDLTDKQLELIRDIKYKAFKKGYYTGLKEIC